jgi:hypothetical protein
LNGVCVCLAGFTRNTETGKCEVGGVKCSLTDVIGICDRCDSDLGLWYGDCLSCTGNFFLQPNSRTCVDYCPSGTFAPLNNRCGEFEKPLVLDITFNLRDEIEITPGLGSITLPGGEFNPISIPDRGFYFDGVNDFLNMTGVVINSSFTVITWIKHTTEADVGIQPIFSLDSPIPEGNPGRFDVCFESSRGLLGRINLSLKVKWDNVYKTWSDSHLSF